MDMASPPRTTWRLSSMLPTWNNALSLSLGLFYRFVPLSVCFCHPSSDICICLMWDKCKERFQYTTHQETFAFCSFLTPSFSIPKAFPNVVCMCARNVPHLVWGLFSLKSLSQGSYLSIPLQKHRRSTRLQQHVMWFGMNDEPPFT